MSKPDRPRSRKHALLSPLADSRALVSRADLHLKALDQLLDRFLRSDPYDIAVHVDADPVEHALLAATGQGWRAVLAGPETPREVVLLGVVRREPPSGDAGLLIGDAVNNLRAALDHAIWSLSTTNTVPPDPLTSPWRDLGWPVVLKAADWPSTCGSKLRFVVDPAIRAEIERLQPFGRRQQEPERDEFAILHELWNIHKHRHLRLTQLWIGLDQVLSRLNRVTIVDSPPGYADDLRKRLREHRYEIVSGGGPRPFVDGAELGRIREAGPPFSWLPDVHMHVRLAVNVAFESGRPGFGANVQQALRAIRDAVVTALDALAPFL